MFEGLKNFFNTVIDSLKPTDSGDEAVADARPVVVTRPIVYPATEPVKQEFDKVVDEGAGEVKPHDDTVAQKEPPPETFSTKSDGKLSEAEKSQMEASAAKSLQNAFSTQSDVQPKKSDINQPEPQEEKFTAVERIAKFFAQNDIGSEKANETLEMAIRGHSWAMKDLWYFINNKLEGVPDSKELWQDGFELLQEAAAAGNKQAISDLAYVKYHGIGDVKADPREALAIMKEAGYKTEKDVFEHWQPGSSKKVPEAEEPVARTVVVEENKAAEETATIKPIISDSITEKFDDSSNDGQKLYGGSKEEVARMIKEHGFDPNECMRVTIPDGGVIIDCDLKDALLKQGVSDPDKCQVEYDGSGYIVNCPTETSDSSKSLSMNP